MHGGWDGQENLGDFWRLDLTSWAWEQVRAGAKGGLPGVKLSKLYMHHLYHTLGDTWLQVLCVDKQPPTLRSSL